MASIGQGFAAEQLLLLRQHAPLLVGDWNQQSYRSTTRLQTLQMEKHLQVAAKRCCCSTIRCQPTLPLLLTGLASVAAADINTALRVLTKGVAHFN